jgi:hypothetical protein
MADADIRFDDMEWPLVDHGRDDDLQGAVAVRARADQWRAQGL